MKYFLPSLALLVTLFLYMNVASYSYVAWDDQVYVYEREPLMAISKQSLQGWKELLSPRLPLQGKFWEYYPVRDLSFGLEIGLAGFNPKVQHTTNLVLHLCNLLFLFCFCRKIGLSWLLSFLVVVSFGVHPLNVEPVAWISSRKDLLYSFFTLSTILLWWDLLERKHSSGWKWFLFLFCCFASLGSKGAGSVVFLLCCGLFFWIENKDKSKLRPLVGLLALCWGGWLLFIIHIGKVNQVLLERPDGLLGSMYRAIGVPFRVIYYLFEIKMTNPMHGPWEQVWWKDPFPVIGIFVLSLLFVLYRKQKERFSFLLLTGLGFFLAVFPHSGILTVSFSRADRFYYLSVGFFFLFFACFIHQFRSRSRWLVIALWIGMLPFWIYLSHQNIAIWKNSQAFWKYNEEVEASHPYQFFKRALKKEAKHKFAEALVLLHEGNKRIERLPQKSIRLTLSQKSRKYHLQAFLDSLFAIIYMRMARRQTGKNKEWFLQKALQKANQALQLEKEMPSVYNVLGMVAMEKKEYAKAEYYLKKQEKLPGMAPLIVLNLVQALWLQQKRSEALQYLRKWMRKNPEVPQLKQWFDGLQKDFAPLPMPKK